MQKDDALHHLTYHALALEYCRIFTYDFWTQLTWPLYGKRLHLFESFLKFGWIILHRSVGSARRHPTAQQIMNQSQYSAQLLYKQSRVINQPPQRFTKVCLKLQNKLQLWFWKKKTLVLINRLTGMPIMVCDFPDPVWP